MITCKICNKELNVVNDFHLRHHNYTVSQYKLEYPNIPLFSSNIKEKMAISTKKSWNNNITRLDRINGYLEYLKTHPHSLLGKTHRGWNKGKKLNISSEGKETHRRIGKELGLSNKGKKPTRIYTRGYKLNLSPEGLASLKECGRKLGLKYHHTMHTKEANIKRAEALKGRNYEELHGKEKAQELRQLRSQNIKNQFTKEEISKNLEKGRQKHAKLMKNPEHYEKYCKTCSETHKKRWQDHDYIYSHTRNMKPNKPEIELNTILNNLFPNSFGYNGNYKLGVSLGRRIPDFVNINGRKQVIELFGDYYHRNDNPEDKIAHYKQFGFNCLIIWEKELKGDRTLLESKLKSFVEEV
jgi:hypothetical protein